ncbi:MAG: indolepyruvate ferredoxin oxidoreductase family protein [Actinomycetota bacterium]|nr:indolepyruvate ferredoxin oxidoreductase family protein [Actinomycetota bacterium]
MSAPVYELAHRFTADHGTVFMSGIQALARIPIEQLRADRRDGYRTAALVSGYPGSPLGGFDGAMRAAAKLAGDLPISTRPALNEEYAASAVMGSQLAAGQPDHRYDGVVGVWYGKAPGVDRATDALRHAGYAGTSPLGGAVAFVGDDPSAKSSTVPSSSAGLLADLHMPLLYPGDPAEALDLGRHAIALSRLSGLWSALKIVADVADGTESIELDLDRVRPVLPDVRGIRWVSGGDVRRPEGKLLTPLTLELEQEIYEVRYELAREYASANQLNRVMTGSGDAWLGIVASGITYREVREAFARLGFRDAASISDLGVRIIEMQMPIPFDRATIKDFARGLDEVFVIEEKQPNMELLIKDALYTASVRPTVIGKHDEAGAALIAGHGALDADTILPALRARLEQRVGDRLPPAPPPARTSIPVTAVDRTPFYCSGCPHNRSTQVPDGTLVGAGIGCHTMALLMDAERVGDIAGITPMGNEGTQWIGMSDFVDRDHFIQNLGDGTYFHSGQLAITAALAAGVNITYKLLFNGAVAMTGGQDPQGQLPVPEVSRVLLEQGAAKVLITTDDTRRYKGVELPRGVDVWDRDRLIEAQEHLATIDGVTVLIHDQHCAAELRRARKRGLVETPSQRVVINERICEGCGDCGQVSNCLSVQPTETPFGRKTRIDQTTCNLDYSCLEGDCPSFVTIETEPSWPVRLAAGLARRAGITARGPGATGAAATSIDDVLDRPLPDPEPIVPVEDLSLRIAGVGGTGVVTVAQVLGTAAMLAGYEVRGLDQIGLSQKAGPVVSDLRLTKGRELATNRLGTGQADLLLAFDQVVAASARGMVPASPDRTVVVGSTSAAPTGAMITHPELELPSPDELDERLAEVTRPDARFWADAARITTEAFGDAVMANIVVLGMAVQAGALPVPSGSIEDAIALNGVAVEANTRAFRLGRHVVADADLVASALRLDEPGPGDHPALDDGLRARIGAVLAAAGVDARDDGTDLEAALSRYAADLVGYQDRDLAADYLATLAEVAAAERRAEPGSTALAAAVAANLHKLLAYKDEYEVARLALEPTARAEAEALAAETGGVMSYRLHPPLLRSMGLGRKLSFGPWTDPVFRLLARSKGVRGTLADPFRWAKVRREERRLPGEYRAAIERVIDGLRADELDDAVALASLPDVVRGYEDLKLERIAGFRRDLAERLAALDAGRR